MPSNPRPNPQGPSVDGIADERELDFLLSLATALQAQQRHLRNESPSEVTAEPRLSDSLSGRKDP